MTTEISGRLPDGCECRLDFYLVSDSADIEGVVCISGMTVAPAFKEAPSEPLKLVASLGGAAEWLSYLAQDWRFMSRAEIADYKSRQESPLFEDDEDDDFGDIVLPVPKRREA